MCRCWRGFQLSKETRKCEDVDECQTVGSCGQLCLNTRGSYKCQCKAGYVSIGANCKAEGE